MGTLAVFAKSSVDNESNLRVLKSAKGEKTKAAKSGKDVKSVKSRPCPDGKKVNDDNIEIIQENSLDKEAMKCFDTSLVTNMNDLFMSLTEFNADISSWDVSSVTAMDSMFRYATEFNSDVSDWDLSSVTDMYCSSSCCPGSTAD